VCVLGEDDEVLVEVEVMLLEGGFLEAGKLGIAWSSSSSLALLRKPICRAMGIVVLPNPRWPLAP